MVAVVESEELARDFVVGFDGWRMVDVEIKVPNESERMWL